MFHSLPSIHVKHQKNTAELESVIMPVPAEVTISMSQHIGAPCKPVVKVGDTVKVGQLIGEQAGFIGAPVHSSVSGTVLAVEPHTHPNKGPGVMSVVIKNDGKNTLDESVKPNKPLEELTPDEIVEIVKDKGIVGMGGATFPTYVKLKPGKPIDAVLINGSECEPYLTADHRVLLEYADDIVYGLRAMMKAVSAPEGVILIEDNKPDAVALLEEKVKPYDNIRVVAAKTQYPVIDLMDSQLNVTEKGGTMRLGAYKCELTEGSKAYEAYGQKEIQERHRHRYEFNSKYREDFEKAGMITTGINPESGLTEIVEIPAHKWFVGVQFHPEYKSTVIKPHPLFVSFIKACLS